ncbi:SIR2 family NAD-dependent protein deacylase [Clostridium sp.]|jgi:small nuclear ribonucleoprotein (snRNP)-like protein|uniref:SIR2 family NAD-dependent protein deacylase n=1 Tax=Clostridium sp. TaxID=1506 RepID=UPI0039F5B3DA
MTIIDNEVKNKEIIDTELSREIVFEKLFNSYNYGNLGMFIGAGFSKAAIGDRTQRALNWFELIKNVSEKLELDFPEDKQLIGVSLPELSTMLCKQLQERDGISYYDAKLIFKTKICETSNWLPSEERIKVFREIFDIIEPNWIITTNYDLVLEDILTGQCKSLSPFNYLSAPKGIIPIYHIHGTRLDKDSIIITQDDYIPLFRPNEYRQSKLAMTIRESTTLVLGYGLGDINVLSALDWSKNIYTEKNEYPYEIVQAFWTSSPKENPYRDENGNIIIEISDLQSFLEELVDYLLDKKEEYEIKLQELNNLIGRLDGGDEELIEKFIEEKEFRINLLDLLSEFEYNMIYSYIEFFTRCINKVWIQTSIDGAFHAYDKYLNIILDIIINYDYKKMPPRLFQITSQALNRVLAYVGKDTTTYYYGDSWDATRTWHRRKNDIPKEMIRQLYNYSKEYLLLNLEEFTRKIV